MYRFNPSIGLVTFALGKAGIVWNHALNPGQAMFLVVLAAGCAKGSNRSAPTRAEGRSGMRIHPGEGEKLWRRVAPRLLWGRRVDHDRLPPARRMQHFG